MTGAKYARAMGGAWTKFYRPRKPDLDYDPEITILNYGPAYLGLRETDTWEGGPAAFVRAHPELFGGGTVSSWEGYMYWAFSQPDVIGPEEQGGWRYQGIIRNQGGRLGQATPDFIIVVPVGKDIACRVQSYFHLELGVEKYASDVEQLFFLQEEYDVVDAFGELFIDDPTGAAAKQMARRVIAKDPTLTPGSGVYLAELS